VRDFCHGVRDFCCGVRDFCFGVRDFCFGVHDFFFRIRDLYFRMCPYCLSIRTNSGSSKLALGVIKRLSEKVPSHLE
jgi:hypothetical protein